MHVGPISVMSLSIEHSPFMTIPQATRNANGDPYDLGMGMDNFVLSFWEKHKMPECLFTMLSSFMLYFDVAITVTVVLLLLL